MLSNHFKNMMDIFLQHQSMCQSFSTKVFEGICGIQIKAANPLKVSSHFGYVKTCTFLDRISMMTKYTEAIIILTHPNTSSASY